MKIARFCLLGCLAAAGAHADDVMRVDSREVKARLDAIELVNVTAPRELDPSAAPDPELQAILDAVADAEAGLPDSD
ncbi:MAG: hypothetical protein R3E84_10070 [Pseudomonadales bacterium]